jgi:hypothetical protein
MFREVLRLIDSCSVLHVPGCNCRLEVDLEAKFGQRIGGATCHRRFDDGRRDRTDVTPASVIPASVAAEATLNKSVER